MLRISSTLKATTAALPTTVTTLSVSWLVDQFKAVAVQRGVIEGTWERPGEITGTQHFEELLREAVKQTGYRGTTVSLLLAHPRLTQQLVETPPLRGPLLAKFVARQAEQQKMFEGAAASAFQPAVSGRESQRLLLHLFPQPLLDQLVVATQRNDLFLTTVIPSTAVLQSQLEQLPMEKDEIALLAADTGGSTTVIIGRNDGQVLLARTLASSWNTEPARLAVDLSRTILFANQQYGVAVGKGLWLFGPNARNYCNELQRHIQAPVKLSPVEYTPFYWATEALKLKLGLKTPNFVGLELQQAPQRRTLMQVTGAVTVLAALACLLGSLWCYVQARVVRSRLAAQTTQIAQLQTRHKELQTLHADLARKQDVVRLVVENRTPPVPGWFLGYLGEAVPPELVVTNLHVKRGSNLWQFQMAGQLQPAGKPNTSNTLAAAVAELSTRLANGPFHCLVFRSVATNPVAATSAKSPALATWAARLSSTAATETNMQTQFSLEGVMR
jgi:Tfp pilus assembly protein PilN